MEEQHVGPSTGSKHTRKSLSTRLTQKYSLGIIERTEALLITFTPGERVLLYLLTALFALSSFALVLNASSYISVEVPAPGGSIVEGETGTARFINPLLTLSQADQDISALVYSGLLRSLPDGTLIPDLAEQYEISPDNLTYTFTLKNEVTFHDGSPVTSADVAYTIAQAQNPEIKSTHRADWDKVTVATPDPRTIIFTLPHPYAPFLENMTLGILPKHAWEKIGEKEFSFDALNTNPIGSGPFRVSNVKKDGNGVIVRYELSPFDGFALGKAHLDHITFVFFPNDTALAKALDGEYINAIGGLSPAFLSSLSRKDLSLVRTPLPRVYAVFLNQSKNTALQDVVVRRALNAAVDRQSLIDTVLGGYGGWELGLR